MGATANVSSEQLFSLVKPWLEAQVGFTLPEASDVALPIVKPSLASESTFPLMAIRAAGLVACATTPQLFEGVRSVFETLHPDQLFSVLGMYELSRASLPQGFAVWGPVPNYVADRASWRPRTNHRAIILPSEGLPGIDRTTFWHCNTGNPIAAFGIYDAARLVALATVTDHGHAIAEIGVDVAPDHKGRGLGRSVISAAGNWILDHNLTIHATVAFWNVPSSRTMLSLGLRYVFTSMHGRPGVFRVPPQSLGSPLPGTEVFDAYPRWAMNGSIRPNPDNP